MDMSASLYQRLGGTEKITQLAHDIVDNHLANKTIATRFAEADVDVLKKGAATFFITGSGGPEVYEGKDMLSVHKHMNISPGEFMAVLDDALAAMEKNNVELREQQEVLYILYSFRDQIVRV